MRGYRLHLMVLAFVFAAPALAAPEDEALQAFNSLYGEEVKRVLATPDTADDAALAGKLLEAARSVAAQPALLAVLCEKAAELGKPTPAGRTTAVQAMELLAEKIPDRKVACLERITALRQMDYDAGRPEAKAQAGEALLSALLALADAKIAAGNSAGASDACRKALALATSLKSESQTAVQGRLDLLAARQKAEQKVAALKARLATVPTDAAARADLVKTLVTELDDPTAAAAFVDSSLDAALQKFVPAAAKGVEQTPEVACKELGDWYRGMADQVTGAARMPLVARAKAYYGRFLALHSAEDLLRAQVVLALKKVEEAAAPAAETPKVEAPARTPPGTAKTPATGKAVSGAGAAAGGETLAAGQWHDILKYIDTSKDPVFGTMPIGWRRDKATVVCANPGYSAESKITVPVMPQGSYDLQMKFAISGSTYGHIGIYLPVGAGSTMLRIDSSGPSGLEYVDGRSSYYNSTGTRTTLVVQRVYAVDVRVTLSGDQASIGATLDGKSLVQWSGPQKSLSPYESMDCRCLGLHTYGTTTTFGSLRLRPVQEARLYKPDGKGPQIVRPPTSSTTGSSRAAPGVSTSPSPGPTP
ncbi:MAG: hypothetical protein NTY65_11135 [Planctomycetota bacterium]|nr:hypothetical protein [Planctomycetota bacterium]